MFMRPSEESAWKSGGIRGGARTARTAGTTTLAAVSSGPAESSSFAAPIRGATRTRSVLNRQASGKSRTGAAMGLGSTPTLTQKNSLKSNTAGLFGRSIDLYDDDDEGYLDSMFPDSTKTGVTQASTFSFAPSAVSRLTSATAAATGSAAVVGSGLTPTTLRPMGDLSIDVSSPSAAFGGAGLASPSAGLLKRMDSGLSNHGRRHSRTRSGLGVIGAMTAAGTTPGGLAALATEGGALGRPHLTRMGSGTMGTPMAVASPAAAKRFMDPDEQESVLFRQDSRLSVMMAQDGAAGLSRFHDFTQKDFEFMKMEEQFRQQQKAASSSAAPSMGTVIDNLGRVTPLIEGGMGVKSGDASVAELDTSGFSYEDWQAYSEYKRKMAERGGLPMTGGVPPKTGAGARPSNEGSVKGAKQAAEFDRVAKRAAAQRQRGIGGVSGIAGNRDDVMVISQSRPASREFWKKGDHIFCRKNDRSYQWFHGYITHVDRDSGAVTVEYFDDTRWDFVTRAFGRDSAQVMLPLEFQMKIRDEKVRKAEKRRLREEHKEMVRRQKEMVRAKMREKLSKMQEQARRMAVGKLIPNGGAALGGAGAGAAGGSAKGATAEGKGADPGDAKSEEKKADEAGETAKKKKGATKKGAAKKKGSAGDATKKAAGKSGKKAGKAGKKAAEDGKGAAKKSTAGKGGKTSGKAGKVKGSKKKASAGDKKTKGKAKKKKK